MSLSPEDELRLLEQKRLTAGLTPEEEARLAALDPALAPPIPGFDVNAAAAEVQAAAAQAGWRGGSDASWAPVQGPHDLGADAGERSVQPGGDASAEPWEAPAQQAEACAPLEDADADDHWEITEAPEDAPSLDHPALDLDAAPEPWEAPAMAPSYAPSADEGSAAPAAQAASMPDADGAGTPSAFSRPAPDGWPTEEATALLDDLSLAGAGSFLPPPEAATDATPAPAERGASSDLEMVQGGQGASAGALADAPGQEAAVPEVAVAFDELPPIDLAEVRTEAQGQCAAAAEAAVTLHELPPLDLALPGSESHGSWATVRAVPPGESGVDFAAFEAAADDGGGQGGRTMLWALDPAVGEPAPDSELPPLALDAPAEAAPEPAGAELGEVELCEVDDADILEVGGDVVEVPPASPSAQVDAEPSGADAEASSVLPEVVAALAAETVDALAADPVSRAAPEPLLPSADAFTAAEPLLASADLFAAAEPLLASADPFAAAEPLLASADPFAAAEPLPTPAPIATPAALVEPPLAQPVADVLAAAATAATGDLEPLPAEPASSAPFDPFADVASAIDAPVPEQAPQPEPAKADPAVFVAGRHRVVLHTSDGEVKRGALADAALDAPEVLLEPQTGGTPEAVASDRIKAIFFMLPAGERPAPPEGKKVRVTFRDGRQVAGFSADYAPERPGFFMVPADTRTHTARIWVYRTSVRQVSIT